MTIMIYMIWEFGFKLYKKQRNYRNTKKEKKREEEEEENDELSDYWIFYPLWFANILY